MHELLTDDRARILKISRGTLLAKGRLPAGATAAIASVAVAGEAVFSGFITLGSGAAKSNAVRYGLGKYFCVATVVH